MNELDININANKILEIGFKNSKKNSFSPDVCDQLLTEIKNNLSSIKGIYFYSQNPGFFCVGGDLKYYGQLQSAEPGVLANKKMSEQLNELFHLKVPTAVGVDGLCLGGGLELLSCFDYVVATPKSLFSFWQRKIALSFGWGGAKRLSQKVSAYNLKKLFISTELVTCYHALRVNLVDELVPRYKLKQAALGWLDKQGRLPLTPIEQLKQSNYLDEEQKAFESLWLQEEHKKALSLFNK